MENEYYVLHTFGARGTRPISGAEYLEFGGLTNCYVLRRGKHAIVIDCGSGLSKAKDLLAECETIDVLLTHLHYDHIMGLLDWSVFPSNARLTFYGTFDKWAPVTCVEDLFCAPYWPVTRKFGEQVTMVWEIPVQLNDGVGITFFTADHPNEASVIRIEIDGVSICCAFDYEHTTPFVPAFIEGCDLLIYDGTYNEAEYPNCKGWGHSTWEQGCRVAREAGIQRLLITHHEPKNTDAELRKREELAKAQFPNVRFAREGDAMTIHGGAL